jgi:hypothetical protein
MTAAIVGAAVSRTTAPASSDQVSVTMPSAPAFETAAASGESRPWGLDDRLFDPEHFAYRRAHRVSRPGRASSP